MANYMAEVAKMLGVEMGQDFECNESSCTYRITEHGLTCNGCYGSDSLMMILNGEYTVKFKPYKPIDCNHIYWFVENNGEVDFVYWGGGTDDLNYYKLGNCYKTKQEAEANRDKWVAFYASDEVLEV